MSEYYEAEYREFGTPSQGLVETKADPAYSTDVMMYSPGQPVYTPKNYANFVSQGYRGNGTVYNCINKIAGGASGIKAKLYTDRTMKREIESHPLLDRWNAPNPMQGAAEFVEQCFGFWHLSGNMYVWANRPGKNEPPEEIYPARPDRTKIVPTSTGIDSYVYGYGTAGAKIFELADTMHLKFPAYDDDYYGLSPIEVAAGLVDQQNEGNHWNTALMQNAGKPASVFMSKGFLTIEQRNQVKAELRRRYQGKSNAGMPMVLEADMDYKSMSMSPYELDWLKSRELNTRDIAAIFNVAPELVGDSAGKTFANVKEAKLDLIISNILPKLDRFYGRLNVWLVPMYEDLKRMGAWFTYDIEDIEELAEMYQAAQKAKGDRATQMWNSGQCSLRVAQEWQGIKAKPEVFLDVYKFGQVLVREEDLEAYAMQSLQKPAAPPMPVPEPMLNQPRPGKKPPTPGGKARSEKAKDAEHTGIMVAFFLDAKAAKKLAIKDGEAASDLHVTLAYLGDTSDVEVDVQALSSELAGFASEAVPLTGSVGGIGRFAEQDGITPVYASVNVAGLQKWRADLVSRIEDAGYEVDQTFDFTPHITLAYIEEDADMPIESVPDVALSFDMLWLAIGDDRYSFPIGDEQYPQKRMIGANGTYDNVSNRSRLNSSIPTHIGHQYGHQSQPAYPARVAPDGQKTLDAHGVYQPDDVEARLAAHQKAGITHLTCVSDGYPCTEVCKQNDGVTVELGKPFPSGHLMEPFHPNCFCKTIAVLNPLKAREVSTHARKADLSFTEAIDLLDMETASASPEQELPQGDDAVRPVKKHGKNSYREFMEALT